MNVDDYVGMKTVKHVGFRIATNPKVIEIANDLAKLENRKPLDAIRQLILQHGPTRIQELKENAKVSPVGGTD